MYFYKIPDQGLYFYIGTQVPFFNKIALFDTDENAENRINHISIQISCYQMLCKGCNVFWDFGLYVTCKVL